VAVPSTDYRRLPHCCWRNSASHPGTRANGIGAQHRGCSAWSERSAGLSASLDRQQWEFSSRIRAMLWMSRTSTIVGYRQDEEKNWVAELSCGHSRHMRHRPPFVERWWASTRSPQACAWTSATLPTMCSHYWENSMSRRLRETISIILKSTSKLESMPIRQPRGDRVIGEGQL
jgi:hypothetical protein